MSAQLIIALVIALAGFGGGWQIQSWRYGAKETQRAKQELAAQQLRAAAVVRGLDNVIEAQSDATLRLRALRVDAAGSRAALLSLSDSADAALRTAATSQAACLERATALSDVLKTVSAERRELSEKADRHVNDLKTLMAVCPSAP
jgi:hypothetical protein